MNTGRKCAFKMKYRIVSMIRFLFVLLLVTLLGLLVYINVFAIGQMTNEAIVSHQNALKMQVDKIDKNLINCSAFLQNMAINNQEIALLNLSTDATESYYLFTEIQKQIKGFAILDNGMNEYFFCAPRSLYPSYYSTESMGMTDGWMRSRINERVRSRMPQLEETGYYSQWESGKIDGNYYLMYMMKSKNIYLGAWCLAQELLINIPLSGGYEKLLITGEDGTCYTEEMPSVDLESGTYRDEDGVEYIQLTVKSEIARIYVVDIVEKQTIIGSLLLIKNIIFVLSAVLIFLLAGTYVVFDKILNQPVRRLVAAMERVRGGDLTQKIKEEARLVEFQLMNDSFNHMVREIQNLKIRIYEEQLKEKETKLQYLQIQIRPHFLVNVLNLIYSMAEVEDYEGIQKLSMYLVNYFRFMFTKAASKVTVAQELEHVQNYMGIQEARFPDSVHFHAHVDEAAMSFKVPPLTIQTFIENSIKYALDLEEQNDIWLDIRICEHGFDIIIRDSGKGFSPQIIEHINAGQMPEGADEIHHIGIFNVLSRLELIYGKEASLTIANDHGAKVTIHLPA